MIDQQQFEAELSRRGFVITRPEPVADRPVPDRGEELSDLDYHGHNEHFTPEK